jgi:hypothetical protein
MNGTEQRQRHTVVSEIEGHIHDVMTVLEAMAAQIVKDREAAATANLLRIREIDACETALANEERIRENLRRSFWQRLRWLVGL